VYVCYAYIIPEIEKRSGNGCFRSSRFPIAGPGVIISCRLDNCNSLFYGNGITEGLMNPLQSVQNAAARLVSGARRYDRITLVLQELHWLPVRRRVDFKMATLVYLSLSGMAPAYLAADCQLVSDEGRRQLRSVT